MLHPFVSSRPVIARRAGGAVTSVVVHVLLIAAFVAASGNLTTQLRPRAGSAERVTYYRLDFAPSSAASAATASRSERPRDASAPPRRPSAMARLDELVASLEPIELSTDLAQLATSATVGPDYAAMVVGADSGGGGLADAIAQVIGKAYVRADASGVYDADVVERAVWPRRGNPTPVYPAHLMRQGIEAAYFVTYVVDSTGRVDRGSISFPEDVLEPFANAIRRALARSRYFPALLGGRPVAQRVRQQFRFQMAR